MGAVLFERAPRQQILNAEGTGEGSAGVGGTGGVVAEGTLSKHFDRVVIGGHVEGVLNRLKRVGRCAKRMVVAVPGRYKIVGGHGLLQLQQQQQKEE